MANPILSAADKYLGPRFFPRMTRLAIGLAHDFWHDGSEMPSLFKRGKKDAAGKATGVPKATKPSPMASRRAEIANMQKQPENGPVWHAMPGEISEKMFGESFVTPGDTFITEKLIGPLGVNKDMSMLDLSSGLGGRLRKTVKDTGTYITGLEPDVAIAARAMELSTRSGMGKHAPIHPYDPNNFKVDRKYDCIVARETFYRVNDKVTFFAAIADALKPHGQVAFTDYIVDPENRDNAAVQKWQANERGAKALSLVEMAEHWGKIGVKIHVHEDMTDFYKKEVTQGLKNLAVFLASGVRPDAETKQAIIKRINIWTHRIAAMDGGMKFYRFYGSKG